MCGIWAWIQSPQSGSYSIDPEVFWRRGVSALEARGPEGARWWQHHNMAWCFTRLAINGLNEGGMQPFTWNDTQYAWMCNGEIYNAEDLCEHIPYIQASGSDCEPLAALWERLGGVPARAVEFCRALDGVFALMLYDRDADRLIVARDPYGVRPLFYRKGLIGDLIFASERKAIEPFCAVGDEIKAFPPGQVWTLEASTGRVLAEEQYHTVPWLKMPLPLGKRLSVEPLRLALEAAVEKRMLSDRPVAALLSGGLDSSLIAALVQKRLRATKAPPLKTFSIGMAGGTDLAFARAVANHIGSDHTEIIVTAEQMLEVIPAVIRDIETYDITTVRASVGNWLIAREIRGRTDCKVVFNGDGSDEVLGGYKYFCRAPSAWAFESECERLLKEIHQYDVLRSDRCMSSHGLEARTPFLDKQFVAVAASYPTATRGRTDVIEKDLLRRAFSGSGLLPEEVLNRRKEAFSDGVSSEEKSWFQIIGEYVEEKQLVPANWRDLAARWQEPRPKTPESFWYRTLYEENYKHTGEYWPFWMPRWSPETDDPSARTLTPQPAGQ
jgi:asparagine synthase (glutamine-hydrolysing)